MNEEILLWGTIGPAVDNAEAIAGLIEEGMGGIRLNMSHSHLSESGAYIKVIRDAEELAGKRLHVLIDLQGCELRLGNFAPFHVGEKQQIYLTCGDKPGLPVPSIVVEAARPNMRILLSDGEIELRVLEKGDSFLLCEVMTGGRLIPKKSISLPDVALDMPSMTDIDIEDLALCRDLGIHHVMLPFAHGKKEIEKLYEEMKRLGLEKMHIHAKIEDIQGARNASEIARYCDELVIARGDLGANVTPWDLPSWQQDIAKSCRDAHTPFMVVTHLLDSMIRNPVPTRAELNDIAHAVWDGASSLMLTGETASGAYPQRAMAYMCKAALSALRYRREKDTSRGQI